MYIYCVYIILYIVCICIYAYIHHIYIEKLREISNKIAFVAMYSLRRHLACYP